MTKILIVDDESKIRELIKKYAAFEGFESTEAENGLAAVDRCAQENFDMIIMDVMMPELDGFSAVKEIRKHKSTPVLMLSARGEEYDKIHGFELGIDDYVVKPFSGKELMMRIHAILARSTSRDTKQEVIEIGGIRIDFTAHIVQLDGQKIDMTPKEYELLFYFVRNKNIALTRESIITAVWGYDFFGDDRTLDTHIKLLRKTLGKYNHFIVTVRGLGYRFETA